jgi:hypothetical protein
MSGTPDEPSGLLGVLRKQARHLRGFVELTYGLHFSGTNKNGVRF